MELNNPNVFYSMFASCVYSDFFILYLLIQFQRYQNVCFDNTALSVHMYI